MSTTETGGSRSLPRTGGMSSRVSRDGGVHGADEPVYTISVVARLLGVHPQTLRQLEREGLLEPARTHTNIRLYSENDLRLLRRILDLMHQGVNRAGVRIILEMERRMLELEE
ncbi:MAG: MerR family transcriptional regulator [Bacillota bacterium]